MGRSLNRSHADLPPTAAPRSGRGRLAWELGLTVLVAVLLGYSWMFGEVTVPNERSRAYLAIALVDYDSVAIDPVVRRYGQVADVAFSRGRLYTDKAPGSSFLGALVYGTARLFVDRDELSIETIVDLTRTWLMLPLGVLGFVLVRALLRRARVSGPAVDVASLSFALGSAYFHYAAAFLGHAIVAVLFLLALFLAWEGDGAGAEAPAKGEGNAPYTPAQGRARRLAKLAGAGMAIGLAGFTEYQAIVPAALFFVFVAARARRAPAAVAAFALGALPFAIGLLAYQDAAFGDPFELSYAHLADQAVQARHARGIAGVGAPTRLAALGTMLSPHRGLLATSPVLLFAPLGLAILYRRGSRGLAALLGATIAYFLAFVFGADMWFAGWGFGPRLLVPCMGLLFLALGPALDVLFRAALASGVARGLAAWGIVYAAAVTGTFPELPPEFLNPLADSVRPLLEAGLHAPNLLTRAGAPFGLATLAPAWALTAIAILVVAFRGATATPSIAQRIVVPVLALALPVAPAAVALEVGPTIGPAAQARFVGWVASMARREEEPLPPSVAVPRRRR